MHQFKIDKKHPITTRLASFLLFLCFTTEPLAEVEPPLDPQQASKGVSDGRNLANNTQFSFAVSTTYRKDNLNWNEASSTINVASELHWKNLDIREVGVGTDVHFDPGWILRGKLDYGYINSGSNQDSDYNGNNRTQEFSRSNNRAGGEVRDASLGAGRTFHVLGDSGKNELSLTALLGLSIHEQYLTMSDGVQSLPATGPYPGLDSSYSTQWLGPWLGVETLFALSDGWSLSASIEYHWADYLAHANWNLRPEFSHPVSFTHTAKGHGVQLSAGLTYRLNSDWSAQVSIEEQEWKTSGGVDQTFFSDGSTGFYQLNEVNWTSTALNFGVTCYF